MMTIKLIQGAFDSADAIDILTQMIHVKIKYHESKMADDDHEEDMKRRESRIIELQKNLYDLQKLVASGQRKVSMKSEVIISEL